MAKQGLDGLRPNFIICRLLRLHFLVVNILRIAGMQLLFGWGKLVIILLKKLGMSFFMYSLLNCVFLSKITGYDVSTAKSIL